jgi:hypothetical protein
MANRLDKTHIKKLEYFRNCAFATYASCNINNNNFELGVDSFGRYLIWINRKESLVYNDPESAITEYNNLTEPDEK